MPTDTDSVHEEQAAQNTDRELWRERPGDFYSPKISVTTDNLLVIDVGGITLIRNIYELHQAVIDADVFRPKVAS